MIVIGIGTGGSQIIHSLSSYGVYDCLTIDSEPDKGIEGITHIQIDKQKEFKDYEELIDLDISSKVGHNAVHVFLFGGGKTTGATLKILEKIKDREITLNYVRPEQNFLSSKQKLRERATFGILQELARSGVFQRINLFDSDILLKLSEVSFLEKKNYLSGTIAQVFHMINWANKTDGVFSNLEEPSEVNRIVSFGMINPEDGEEIFYFPLDSQRETCYYFFMNREALGTPGVIEKINNQIKQRNEQSSFKIIESDWETNHVYFESFTNIIQKTQINTEE